jgi:hypothetical protein
MIASLARPQNFNGGQSVQSRSRTRVEQESIAELNAKKPLKWRISDSCYHTTSSTGPEARTLSHIAYGDNLHSVKPQIRRSIIDGIYCHNRGVNINDRNIEKG